jgi:hypothetical protein
MWGKSSGFAQQWGSKSQSLRGESGSLFAKFPIATQT